MAHPDWKDEEVSFLREHWAKGYSASEIAKKLSEKFGRKLTRNAVITKADRLQLSAESRKEPSAPAAKSMGGDCVESKRITPVETCRWPTGVPDEPDFSYCGKPVQRRSPFCSEHKKMAYRPKEVSRKKRSMVPDAANRINF
tara:strand:- start:15957 stop:16382 length:426 start_codon:yes stop_codon:yes gene_type:complete